MTKAKSQNSRRRLPFGPDRKRNLNNSLSVRQEQALAIYVRNGFNDMTHAMIESGFSPKTAQVTGSQLLKTQKAKDYLAGKFDKALRKYNKTADDVLNEIAVMAFADPAEMFDKEPNNGIKLKNIFEMGPIRRAIRKIKHKQRITVVDPKKEDSPQLVENDYEYELWDKVAANKILAQHHNIIEGQGGDVIVPLVLLPDNARDAEFEVIEDKNGRNL